MDNGFYAATTALDTNLRLQEVVARNLANVRTVGYKRQVPVVENFNMILNDLAGITPTVDPALVNIAEVASDFRPGTLTHTGSPLDMAIEGDGFFVLQTTDGLRYTRAGNFTRASDGTLVTDWGARVVGTGGAIQIPAQVAEVKVLPDGTIVGRDGSGQTAVSIDLGKFKVVTFPPDVPLTPSGYATFVPAPPETAGTEAPQSKVRQGYVEQSNVNPVDELVQMITVLRNFQAAQRVLLSMQDAAKQLAQASSKTI